MAGGGTAQSIAALFDRLGLTDATVVARGATSAVFAAYQPQFGRHVAVKLFDHGLEDAKARRRFGRECESLGGLIHPNVVTLYDSGFDAGRPYILMEYCSGGSLQDRLHDSGPLPLEEVLRVGVKIAAALQLAHDRGILHRDIKPANVLVTALGEPKLADFGIAGDPAELSISVAEALTPVYAAPEVLDHGGGSPASDVWALGGTLYALLLGRAPYARAGDAGGGLRSLLNRISTEPLPAINRADVPVEVVAVLRSAMRQDPTERIPTPRQLALALQSAQRNVGLPVTEYIGVTTDVAPIVLPEQARGSASDTTAHFDLESTAVLDLTEHLSEVRTVQAAGEATVRSTTSFPEIQTTDLSSPDVGRDGTRILSATAPENGTGSTVAELAAPSRKRMYAIAAGVTAALLVAATVLAIGARGHRVERGGVTSGIKLTTSRVTVGSQPGTPVLSRAGRDVLVSNSGSNSVSVISTITGRRVTTVPVGSKPATPVLSRDGQYVFVADTGSNEVSVISTVTTRRVATVHVGSRPGAPVLSRDGSEIYVPNSGSGSVTVVSTTTFRPIATVDVGSRPITPVMSRDGREVYVTNSGDDTVSVISAGSHQSVATVKVGQDPYPPIMTADGREAYVSNYGGNTVSVISTVTHRRVASVPTGSHPGTPVMSRDGHLAYVANSGNNTVSVINTETHRLAATIGVGHEAYKVVLSPNGRTAYAANSGGDTVSV
ncbi:MAG: protein kinase, partial [Frankiaceae bacterium]|nr:protein kinase [Frankiaceae bacterium]